MHTDHRAGRARPALALGALLAGGCFTYRVQVPPVRPQAPAGQEPLPVEVAWRLTPAAAAAERRQPSPVDGQGTWAVPVGAALGDAWAAALPLAFGRPVPWEAGTSPPPGAAGTLEIDLEDFDFAWPDAGGQWSAAVAERLVLRDRRGELVAAIAARGAGVRQARLFDLPRSAIGDTSAAALRQACEGFLRELPGDAGVRAWLAREAGGPAAPAPLEHAAASVPVAAPPPAQPPLDVTAPLDPHRHRWGLWARVGPWFPAPAAGQLSGARTGWTLGAGAGIRLAPAVTAQADLDYTAASYSAERAPAPGLLVRNAGRVTLETMGLSIGARLHHRLGPVELHAGAGLALLLTKMTLPQSMIGLPGEWVEDGSAGGWYVAAGAEVLVGATSTVGVEWRHLDATAGSSEIAQGSPRVGGDAVGLVLRLYTP